MDIPYDILKSQYESLKVEYDEFCESSREIETELEKSLKETEAKNNDLLKKCKLVEDRLQQQQSKSTQLTSDNVKMSSELNKLKDSYSKLQEDFKRLEVTVDDLNEKNRCYEASEDDLKHKISTLEEEVFFLKQEVIELESNQPVVQTSVMEDDRDYQPSSATELYPVAQSQQNEFIDKTLNLTVAAMETSSATVPAIEDIKPANADQMLLESSLTNEKQISVAVHSNNLDVMRQELLKQSVLYENLKRHNAKLLQSILSLKGNIQVFCRTRPPFQDELTTGKICLDIADENEILCFDRKNEQWKSFNFDRVWSLDANQADVFTDVEPLAVSVIDGNNACIMAYGQTGSGKTHTMNGYGKDFGVSYRTLHTIFNILERKKSQSIQSFRTKHSNPNNSEQIDATNEMDGVDPTQIFNYSVEVSMLEIYNDQVNDLLVEGATSSSHNLDIRQAGDGGVHVPGLKQVQVNNIQDVMRVFSQGSSHRATTTTNLNERSSRSHSILSVCVTCSANEDSTPVKGKLNLVDLAGSEKVSKSGVTGQAMKEAQHINKSLSALGDVLEALDQKSKHIPYRNSKLTYLLQDSLSGMSKTVMIVTVCPTEHHAEETLFTLQFASRVKNITFTNTGSKKNNSSNIKNMEEAIKLLKAEIKEYKRYKLHTEDNIQALKHEIQKHNEKSSSLIDNKQKVLEDLKLKHDVELQSVMKNLSDTNKNYLHEKEMKQKLSIELELIKNANKKFLEEKSQLVKEKDHYIALLKQQRDIRDRSAEKQLSIEQSPLVSAPSTGITGYRRVLKPSLTPANGFIAPVPTFLSQPTSSTTYTGGIESEDPTTLANNMNSMTFHENSSSFLDRKPPRASLAPARVSILKPQSNNSMMSPPPKQVAKRPRMSILNKSIDDSPSIDLSQSTGQNMKTQPQQVKPSPVSIISRSKDAIQKHQERMERIREQKATETTRTHRFEPRLSVTTNATF